jgi:hypothetical protein
MGSNQGKQNKQTKNDNTLSIPQPSANAYQNIDYKSLFFYVGDDSLSLFAFAVSNRETEEYQHESFFWDKRPSLGDYKVIIWSHSYNLDCSRMYAYLKQLVNTLPYPTIIVCYDYPGFGMSKPELKNFSSDMSVRSLDIIVDHLETNHKISPNNMYFVGHEIGVWPLTLFMRKRQTLNKNMNQNLMLIAPDDKVLSDSLIKILGLNNRIMLVQYRSYKNPLGLCAAQQAFPYLKKPIKPLWIRAESYPSDPSIALNKYGSTFELHIYADYIGADINNDNILNYITPVDYQTFIIGADIEGLVDPSEKRYIEQVYKENCQTIQNGEKPNPHPPVQQILL